MDKNSKDRRTISTILKRPLQIPAWLITVIAIILGFAGIFVREGTINGLFLIILALILLIWGAFQTPKPDDGSTRGAVPLREVTLGDEATPYHHITISDFPENVDPTLLPIPDRDSLKSLNKDGVGKVLTIAGNLVFRNEQGELVQNFSSPVKVTFNYTEADEQEADDEEIIPVYLYTYPPESDEPSFQIWKPFQNFSINKELKTMTIEVLFWGDTPVSPGTKKGT